MFDAVLDFARDTMDSPWVYPLLLAFCAVDAFFPAFPSDTVVVVAGVFAAGDAPSLPLVIAVCAVGAIIGDNISYWLGSRAKEKFDEHEGKAFVWARKMVEERGGLILFAARYVPGGRTAATLTMGAAGYPWPRFLAFDVLAGIVWSLNWSLVGYVGGAAFEDDPVKGLLLGFGLAAAVTLVVEAVRRVRRRAKGASS